MPVSSDQMLQYVGQRFTLRDSNSTTSYQRKGLEGVILEAPKDDTRADYVFAYFQELGAPFSYFLIFPEKVRFVDSAKRVIDTEWVAGGRGYTSVVQGFGKVIRNRLAECKLIKAE